MSMSMATAIPGGRRSQQQQQQQLGRLALVAAAPASKLNRRQPQSPAAGHHIAQTALRTPSSSSNTDYPRPLVRPTESERRECAAVERHQLACSGEILSEDQTYNLAAAAAAKRGKLVTPQEQELSIVQNRGAIEEGNIVKSSGSSSSGSNRTPSQLINTNAADDETKLRQRHYKTRSGTLLSASNKQQAEAAAAAAVRSTSSCAKQLSWKSSTGALNRTSADKRHAPQQKSALSRGGASKSLLQLNTTTAAAAAAKVRESNQCQLVASDRQQQQQQRFEAREQIANQRRASSLAAEISFLKGGNLTSRVGVNLRASQSNLCTSAPLRGGFPIKSREPRQLIEEAAGPLQRTSASALAKPRGLQSASASARAALHQGGISAPANHQHLQHIQRLGGKQQVQQQQQPLPAKAAVTNSRVRQGALYARRQLRLTPSTAIATTIVTPQTTTTQDFRCSVDSSSKLLRFGRSVSSVRGIISNQTTGNHLKTLAASNSGSGTCRRQLTRLTRAQPRPLVTACQAKATAAAAASHNSNLSGGSTLQRATELFESASRRARTVASVAGNGGGRHFSKKLSLNSSSSSSLSLDAPVAKIKRPRGDATPEVPVAVSGLAKCAGHLVTPEVATSCRRRWSSLESSSSTNEASSSLTVSSSSSALSGGSSSSCLASSAHGDERSGRQRRRRASAAAAAAATTTGNRQVAAAAEAAAAGGCVPQRASSKKQKAVATSAAPVGNTRCEQQLEKALSVAAAAANDDDDDDDDDGVEKRQCDTSNHHKQQLQTLDSILISSQSNNININLGSDNNNLFQLQPQPICQSIIDIEFQRNSSQLLDSNHNHDQSSRVCLIDGQAVAPESIEYYAAADHGDGIHESSSEELTRQQKPINGIEVADVELFPVVSADEDEDNNTNKAKESNCVTDCNQEKVAVQEQMALAEHHRQNKLNSCNGVALESATTTTAFESQNQQQRRQSQTSTATSTSSMSCDLLVQEQQQQQQHRHQQDENTNLNATAVPNDTIEVTQMISVEFPKLTAAATPAGQVQPLPNTLLKAINIEHIQNHTQVAATQEHQPQGQPEDQHLSKKTDVCSEVAVAAANPDEFAICRKQQQQQLQTIQVQPLPPSSGEKNDISINLEPICDYYDLETRPFARGKFAQVKRCVKRDTQECFAAKCIKKRRRLVDIRHEILLEIEALKLSYQTEFIVKLYEVYETPNEMVLILEMAKGGELQRVLDEEEAIEEPLARKMITQILDGLVHLHANQIAHLDIKPQNLLLTEPFPHGDVKLCDFGISRRISNDCEIRDICGTPDYVAPEILRYDPISLATDMWSLGVLTYVLLSGYSPFGSENKQQTFCNITQANLDFPGEIFGKISEDAVDFIRKLIVREPSGRLTSGQARSHHWINQ